MLAREAADLGVTAQDGVELVPAGEAETDAAADCELALVVGGDGTILRAAETTHRAGVPLLGVNLGHIGFLAEAEPDDVASTVEAIVGQRYVDEERLTLDVEVYQGKELLAATWALNEASVEKAARERMLEVVVEIDGRPLSRWGCDGVVCATPTGSTAYNFSAGGPVVWPGVQALLMVPISAHALFARPMVVAPTSVLAVELVAAARGSGWAPACCGPTGDAPSTCRPGPASRCGTAAGRCTWCGCTRRRSPTGWSPSSTSRSRGGAAGRSVAGGRRERRGAEGETCLRRSGSAPWA